MTVAGATISGFRSSFRGPVIAPGDAEYDAARRVWTALFDRRPALVVRPIDVADAVTESASAGKYNANYATDATGPSA